MVLRWNLACCTAVFHKVESLEPLFGLHLNNKNYEVHFNFWLTGEQLFMEDPSDICSPSNALDLLGLPVWGSDDFYDSHFVTKIDQASHFNSPLSSLEDPQFTMELLEHFHIVPLIMPWAIY